MGRWHWDKKHTVEDCKSISMPFLRRNGYFDCPGPQPIIWTNRFGQQTANMTVILHTSGDETYIGLCYTMTDRDTGKETEPTRKARRLHVLKTRLEAYGRMHHADLV
jgi:hypothetical protein